MADRRFGPPEWPPTSTDTAQPGRSPHIPRQTGYGSGGYPPADARTSAPYGTAPRSAPPYTEEFTYAPPVPPAQPSYNAEAGYAPPAQPAHHAETGYAPPRHGSTDTAAAYSRHTARHTGEFRTVDDRRPPAGEPRGPRTRREDRNRWHWLLLVPIVLPLMPGLYNRIEPTLLGIPFFYWSQLGFAFLASGVIAFVQMKVRTSA
jgi:hypothetical protein